MLKKILTINEINSDNIGDQAIADSMLRFCSYAPDVHVDCADFSFRSEMVTGSIKSNRAHRKSFWLQTFMSRALLVFRGFSLAFKIARERYDLAVIGGGQLVLSNGTFPISMIIYITLLRLHGTRVKLIAIGVGERFSLFDKCLYRLAFLGVDDFMVRDKKSKQNLRREFSRDSEVCPDIVYFMTYSEAKLQNRDPGGAILVAPVEFSVHKRYALEMGGKELSYEEYLGYWERIVQKQLERKSVSQVILSGTTIKDNMLAEEIFYRLNPEKRNHLKFIKSNDLVSYLNVASCCKEVVSGRMHALILCHILGASLTPYQISQKIKGFEDEYLSLDPVHLNAKLGKIQETVLL